MPAWSTSILSCIFDYLIFDYLFCEYCFISFRTVKQIFNKYKSWQKPMPRNKEYREHLKAKENPECLKKDRERKKAKRDMLKNSQAQYNEYKKNRQKTESCQESVNWETNTWITYSSACSAPNSHSKQAFGKAKNRANKHLPNRPAKINQVISYLL